MTISIKLTVQVHSDFHIGTGSGRGRATDAVFLSDEEGLPYIAGSTIKGLASVEAKRLIKLYEPHLGRYPAEHDFEPSPFREIFGGGNTTGCAEDCCFFDNARLPDTYSLENVRQVRTGRSARDRVSGRAKHDHLFFFEDAPAADFECSLTSDSDLSATAMLLLLLSLRRIEALGGQRRRGKGRVECHVEVEEWGSVVFPLDQAGARAGNLKLPDEGWDEAFRQFARPILLGQTTYSGPPMTRPSGLPSGSSSTGNACWLMYARSESPLVLSHDRAIDNVIPSLDYIPGTTVRGAVAWNWLRQGVPDSDPLFQQAIVKERVAFGPLHPVHGAWSGRATMPIPAPASIYTCKRYPGPLSDSARHHGVADRFRTPLSQRCRQGDCDAALTGCGGYLQLVGDPSRDLTLDNMQVPMQFLQRNDVDQAQLYGIEAIPRGIWFAGYVWGPEDLLESLLGPWKETWHSLRVGKVRTRGLGHLSVQCVPAAAARHATFPGLLPVDWPRELSNQETFFVTLYSDLIALDCWMRPVTRLDAAELWRQMGGTGPPPFAIEAGFASTRRIGGYLGAVGVPRTPDIALRAGSTWKLTWTEADAASKQQAVATFLAAQSNGIGFRRAEGHGRVLLNCPLHLVTSDLLSERYFEASCVTGRRPDRELEMPRSLPGDEWMLRQTATGDDDTGYRRLLHELAQQPNPADAMQNALTNSRRLNAGKRESFDRFVNQNRQALFGGDKEEEVERVLDKLKMKDTQSPEMNQFVDRLKALAERNR